MPEMHFTVRWPDGSVERCYSPSLVMKEHFAVGEAYGIAEFRALSRVALGIASERVRARHGFACSRALGQLARIEAACGHFAEMPGARVRVDAFEE